MITEIFFNIEAEHPEINKKEDVDFSLEFNEAGECIDGYSFNPCTGWTGYTLWRQGWSMDDTETNILLEAIKEYAETPEIVELIGSMEITDINKNYKQLYDCENVEHDLKSNTFLFNVVCTTIEEREED